MKKGPTLLCVSSFSFLVSFFSSNYSINIPSFPSSFAHSLFSFPFRVMLRRSKHLRMAPTIIKRDGEPEGEEGTERRTRVDDTDPSIIFTPGPSPYLQQQQQQNAAWTVIKDSAAFNGSAVMTNRTDAQLSFNFTGDSLTLGLLYTKDGTNVKATLENGSSFPVEVTAAEAADSGRDGDKGALQKKNFRLTGLTCANHTVTVTAAPASDGRGGNATQTPLYFDWFSFPSADNPSACSPVSSASPAGSNASSAQHDHDHTLEYIGISLGATLLGFIVAIIVTRHFRRREQRRQLAPAADPVDRTFRPGRKQTSDESLSMPLNMSQPNVKPSMESASIFRPRGIHALAHDDSFSSSYTGPRPSIVDSPSATATFPLMPMSQGEHVEMVEDAGHSIGTMLMCLEHDPLNRPREARHSGAKLKYEKARLSSSIASGHPGLPASPMLVGGYELQRMPKNDFAAAAARTASKGKGKSRSANKAPRRPKTTSAVDRLRTEAKQLDIQRPLSPFDRTRPTTSSGTMSSKPSESSLSRLATAPANSSQQNRFRRNSVGSADTRWSRVSAEASSLEGHKDKQWSKSQLDVAIKVDKTTDSEADMWINSRKALEEKKNRKRRNSIAAAPKRPPKSPHRPSTGQGAAPPPMASHPLTLG